MKTVTRIFAIVLVLGLVFGFLHINTAKASTLDVCNSGCTYSSIQDAINVAVSGDTIVVGAGSYSGFSIVDKTGITISGSGDAITLIEPTTLITTGVGHKSTANVLASVFIDNSTNITIEGLTIKSTTSTPGAGGADAIVFWNASTGSINESVIQGIYTISGSQTGQGLAVDAGSGETTILTLTNTDIFGAQKNAIDVVDGNTTSPNPGTITLNVSGGEITGIPTSTLAQNGIMLWNMGGGVLNATISGVTISGFNYLPDGNEATGILVYGVGGGSVAISGNTFANNEDHVYDNAGILNLDTVLSTNTFASGSVKVTGDPVIYGSIQAAVSAADPGDTIEIFGTHLVSSLVKIEKEITLSCDPAALIQVSGAGDRFEFSAANASLVGCEIEKTDKTGEQNIIRIRASGITIQNNTIWGKFVIGDGEVSRAIVINAGNFTDLLITGNTFYALRQPAYVSGTHSGTVSDNYTYGTKGWVLEGGNLTFSNNTWGTGADANVYDIAIISLMPSTYYTDIPAMSAANNDASIEDQRISPATLSIVYVDDDAAICGLSDPCGTAAYPYRTIADGVTRVVTGGTIHVAPGLYSGNVTVTKAINFVGAQANTSVAGRTAASPSESTVQGLITVNASNVNINGFTLTNPSQTYAVSIPATSNNLNLSYNIIDTVGAAGLASNVHAILVNRGPDNITIAHNLFNNIRAGVKSVSAIGVLDSVSENSSTGLLIQDNVFSNIISATKGAYGIIINNLAGAPGAQILDNDFSGLSGGWTHAIGLEGPTPNAVVTGNTFTDLTAAGVDNVAVFFEHNPNGGTVNVESNAFNGSGYYGVAVALSDLPGGTFGYNYVVDAERNYWGATTGPGTTTLVGPNVDYVPYWTDAAMTTLGGPVHNVTQDLWFATIQEAVSDAGTLSGDVITVAAGTYAEQVTINKAVDLRGPNYGISAGVTPGTRVPEALITYPATPVIDPDSEELGLFNVNVADVSIDGFTLDGQGVAGGVGINAIEDNLLVKNNIVKNFPYMGIWISSWRNVNGSWINTFYFTGTQIQDNLVTNDSIFTDGFGVYVQGGTGIVDGNVVDHVRNGIQIQPYGTPGAGTVSNNEFSGYRTPLYFNYTENSTASWSFSNNDLYGLEWPEGAALGAGETVPTINMIRIETFKAGNVTFIGNTINIGAAADTDKIYMLRKVNETGGTIDLEATLDTNTWEKVVVVRDSLDQIRETTLATPKLNGDATFFNTIQSAIDDIYTVAGDTVDVGPGTYAEQVTITKDITLLGAGKTLTTIQAFASMPVCFTTTKDHRPVVCVKDAIATIDGFTIDGLGLGGSNVNFEGIAFRNAGGTLQNSLVKDIRNTPFSGAQHGVAIYSYNDDVVARTIHVLDNEIIGFQKNAMALNASDTNPLTVDVQRNVITGAGTTTVTAQNGIQVWADAGTGLIKDNQISGIAYDGTGWAASSILNYYADNLEVIHNTITGAHMGIYFVDGSGLIDNNTLAIIEAGGTGQGIYAYGGDVEIKYNNLSFQTTPLANSLGIGVGVWDGNDVAANVHDNVVTGFDWGLDFTESTDPLDTGSFTSISAVNNTLYGNTNALYIGGPISITPYIFHNKLSDGTNFGVYSDLVGILNAEANWWGSMFGPATDMYVGDVDFIKWCGDAECTYLLPDDAGVIEIGPETITETIIINQPNLTIRVLDGTIIAPASGACFEVNASSTRIYAETNLGAVCVPADGFNGIDVAAGLMDIRIKGLEFSGVAGGVDGINFAGAITHLMILDNWFHDLEGDGILFNTAPAGTISIQGNLFQDNVGYGINNVVPGVTPIPAAYNSWGHIDGAPAGDEVSAGVVADPWTHVDLYIGASGVGSPVTYTVYGNLKNVTGISFTLKYPAGLTLDSYDDFGQFVPPDLEAGLFSVDETNRTISFNGYVQGATPISGQAVALFSATFTGSAPGGVLDLMEATDSFSMPALLSNNIYAAALVDGVLAGNGYTVTGYVWMQGRGLNAYAGIPGTLTGTGIYGPYSATSIDFPADNLIFSNVAEGVYIFTTNQPRYLNIPASMAKTVYVTEDEWLRILPELLLIGGNADWRDNIINSQDASKVGRNYLKTVFEPDADVNFDNKVNLLDITMVGGNYTKTSTSVYGSWNPPTPAP